jgi:hypothetical protein
MNLEYNIGILILRSCNDHLQLSGEHTTAEICQVIDGDGTIYTIAYWKDGDLIWVGDRPLHVPDRDDFWKLVEIGCGFFQGIYKDR